MLVQIEVCFELPSFMWENVYQNFFGFSGACSCLKRLFLYAVIFLKSITFLLSVQVCLDLVLLTSCSNASEQVGLGRDLGGVCWPGFTACFFSAEAHPVSVVGPLGL